MAKKSLRQVMVKKGDLQIARVARLLKRSYSWVYTRRGKIGRDTVFKYKGVIFIRPTGFDKLAAMSARAPKRGRPKMMVRISTSNANTPIPKVMLVSGSVSSVVYFIVAFAVAVVMVTIWARS